MRRKIVSSVHRINSVWNSWWENANKVIYQEIEIKFKFSFRMFRWGEGILIDFHAKFYGAENIQSIQPLKWIEFSCPSEIVHKFKSRSLFICLALHNEFHRFYVLLQLRFVECNSRHSDRFRRKKELRSSNPEQFQQMI